MAYEPPTNPSLWQVLLADQDGFVTTIQDAFDEFGPEGDVEVSIRRLSALPLPQTPGVDNDVWRLPGTVETADIAVEWRLDLVDEDGDTDHVEAQLKMAAAMAAGLNGAIANAGDWNRGTELAAALHDLGDRIATFTGSLPGYMSLSLFFWSKAQVSEVDALAVALLDAPGEAQPSTTGSWYHRRKVKVGGLNVDVHTPIPDPEKEDKAALKARIAELEAKLAGGAA